jgi:hypothetical protein
MKLTLNKRMERSNNGRVASTFIRKPFKWGADLTRNTKRPACDITRKQSHPQMFVLHLDSGAGSRPKKHNSRWSPAAELLNRFISCTIAASILVTTAINLYCSRNAINYSTMASCCWSGYIQLRWNVPNESFIVNFWSLQNVNKKEQKSIKGHYIRGWQPRANNERKYSACIAA